MSETQNPYEAPRSPLQPPASGEVAEAERVRREHLKHEASVQGVGALYAIGGSLMLLAGLAMIGTALLGGGPAAAGDTGFLWLLVGLYLVLGATQLWTGIGLRRLRPSARVPGVLFAVLGLLGFPLGTLISLYILYLLLSQKGGVVLGPDYARVRELTPHVKYRTPLVVWIALAVLVLLICFVAFMAISN